MTDPLQTLWKKQPKEEFTMSLADIHARAETFQSRIRRRNWREYIAGVLVAGYYGWVAVTVDEPLIKAGAALIVLASLFVSWTLYKKGRAAKLDETQDLANFHRAELVRQRDALQSVWTWYHLAPFLPGAVVFLAGIAFGPEPDATLAGQVAIFALGAVIIGAVFGGIGWLNARAARQLDAEIAALDRVREG
jgi:hypothetical protein